MSNHVLLPVPSHPPWGRTVAETLVEIEDETITPVVLYVFDTKEKELLLADTEAASMTLDELATRKKSVATVLGSLEEIGFDPVVVGVESDTRGDAILEATRSTDADRIYLFNRKRSAVGKSVFGSAVQRVLQHATVPVVTIPQP